MNLSKLTLAVLGILLTALPIHAAFAQKRGGTDGGGGGVMFRYESDGNTIKDAELIDLWEARNLRRKWEKTSPYKLDIPYGPDFTRSDEPVDVQIQRAMAKLRKIDPLFAERVRKDLLFVQDPANWNELEDDITLPLPKDAKLNYQSSEKTPKGMFFFDDELNKLSIKPEIFARLLNNTNIAAAFTHEAIYKTLRELEMVEGDSTEVRKINACLYATDDCFGLADAKLRPLSGAQFYSCTAGSTHASVMLELNPKIHQTGWQFFRVTLQADHLGSTYYSVPVTAHFNLSFDGTEATSGFPNFSNQIFEQYLPINSRNDGNQLRSILQVSQGTPLVTAHSENGNLVQLTIMDGGQIVWNGVDVPEQVFTCSRLK